MALPTNVTNANIDTAAAAVAGPLGPLTRVTDVDALGLNPDSEINIEFTTDGSSPAFGEVFTVWLTYRELSNSDYADVLLNKLKEAAGNAYQVYLLKAAIDAIDTVATAVTAPYTQADYEAIIEAIRVNLPWTRHM